MRGKIQITVMTVLVIGLVVFLAGCGGATTTTTAAGTPSSSSESPTLSTESTTTTAAPSTSSSEATTTSAGTGTSATTGTTTAGGAGLGQLAVQMTGDEVVPPVTTTGSGTLTLGIDLSEGVTYKLEVRGLTDVTSAGIYLGKSGQTGELVVNLLPQAPPAGATSGAIAQGTITPDMLTGSLQGKQISDAITSLLMSGGGAYAQVNTKANPNGEVRGQIDLSNAGAATGTTAAASATSSS